MIRKQPGDLHERNRQGFTLIEMSLVLIIIGLIVGGILVGRELIDSAMLGKIGGDVDKFRMAYSTFKLKYNAIPGDTPIASQLLSNCSGSVNCNGTGDSKAVYYSWIGGVWNNPYEALKIWRHLSLAGLIDGNYVGYLGPAGTGGVPYLTPGVNMPGGPYGASGYVYSYFQANTQFPAAFDGYMSGSYYHGFRALPPGNYIKFGKERDPGGDATFGLSRPFLGASQLA